MNRLLDLPFDRIIGRECLDLICGKEKKESCAFTRTMKTRERTEEETFWHGRWYQVRVDPVIAPTGKIIGAVHVMTDISRQKESDAQKETALKALHVSEAFYRNLFENSLVGISQALPDGRLVRCNLAYARMYGYASPGEIIAGVTDIGQELYADPNERKRILAILKAKGVMEPTEIKVRRRDGTLFVVLAGAREIRDAEGKLICYQAEHVDVTPLKQVEDALRETSKRLRLALASAKAGTWDWDIKTGDIEWSPQMFELFGLDPRTSSASFETWRKVVHPEDVELAGGRINQALKQRMQLDSDYRVVFPDGRVRWINAQGEGVYDDSGRPTQMIGTCQDISDRKQTEEQIRASLLEKEILLKEIHHRVKNNLQIISGLLTLQAAQIDDERLQLIIKDSQSRIWTMALIHQTLYQSGNMAAVDMADYIHTLASNLLSSHARVAMPPTVRFELQPLHLAIDKAIPLALIVNELLTNALKHAFPDGRAGEIRISLQERRGVKSFAPTKDADTILPDRDSVPAFELIVADNGVGLPAGFDVKTQKSLGLQLVVMLTKQLDATLAIESKGGTSAHVIVTANEKNKTQS
jgi:PAS domain S-box-containing protein